MGNYDLQFPDTITNFVEFSPHGGGGTLVKVDPTGMGMFTDSVVILDGVGLLDVATLLASGNLLV
jgi:hypothetical protein